MAKACASCPFSKGNNEEWGAIVARLQKAHGMPVDTSGIAIFHARHSIEQDVTKRGDFNCHCSVFDEDMKLKPQSEWRQCAGAAEFYRKGGV